MQYQERDCVCCGSNRLETLYEIPDVRVVMKTEPVSLVITVQLCRDCGLVLLNPLGSDAFYRAYYSDYLRVAADAEGVGRGQKRQQQHEYCQSRIPAYQQGGRIFDIGAHDGSLLSFFKADGWQVQGCDFSQSGHGFAREAYGIELDLMDFMQTDYAPGTFDVVTIFQVLEHILAPLPLLQKVRTYLRDTGLFILEVPNLDRPSADNLANYFDFEHVSYFELGSLTNILARAGFEVVDSEIYARNQALRVVARKGPVRDPVASCYRENRDRVLAYKEQYTRIIARITSRLQPFVDQTVILYGAGQHTEQLLRELGPRRLPPVMGLVDSSPEKWGQTVFGFEVHPPQWLATQTDVPVVISSFSFARAIAETIREFNPRLPIVELYDT